MKILLLCLLFACSVVYGQEDRNAGQLSKLDPTKYLWQIVNRQKSSVETISKGLVKYEKQTNEKIQVRANSIKTDGMLAIEKVVKASHDDVQKEVNKAKEAGKNADFCLQNAKTVLNTVSTNGNAELDTCVKNGWGSVNLHLENVQHTIQTAQQMLADLDAIVPDCYSSIFIKMQSCVFRKTLLMANSVKKLRANAVAVKRSTSAALVKTFTGMRSCSTTVVSGARMVTTEVKLNGAKCVRNVETLFTEQK